MCGWELNLPEVYRHKGEPNHAGSIHSESDILGLIKGGRNFSGKYGINGTQNN